MLERAQTPATTASSPSRAMNTVAARHDHSQPSSHPLTAATFTQQSLVSPAVHTHMHPSPPSTSQPTSQATLTQQSLGSPAVHTHKHPLPRSTSQPKSEALSARLPPTASAQLRLILPGEPLATRTDGSTLRRVFYDAVKAKYAHERTAVKDAHRFRLIAERLPATDDPLPIDPHTAPADELKTRPQLQVAELRWQGKGLSFRVLEVQPHAQGCEDILGRCFESLGKLAAAFRKRLGFKGVKPEGLSKWRHEGTGYQLKPTPPSHLPKRLVRQHFTNDPIARAASPPPLTMSPSLCEAEPMPTSASLPQANAQSLSTTPLCDRDDDVQMLPELQSPPPASSSESTRNPRASYTLNRRSSNQHTPDNNRLVVERTKGDSWHDTPSKLTLRVVEPQSSLLFGKEFTSLGRAALEFRASATATMSTETRVTKKNLIKPTQLRRQGLKGWLDEHGVPLKQPSPSHVHKERYISATNTSHDSDDSDSDFIPSPTSRSSAVTSPLPPRSTPSRSRSHASPVPAPADDGIAFFIPCTFCTFRNPHHRSNCMICSNALRD